MRKLFLSRLIELIDKNAINSEVLSKVKYDQLVNRIKRTKFKPVKSYDDTRLLREYDVIVEDNVEKLLKPSFLNQHNGYYVYEEELFDIIKKTHDNLEHPKLPALFNALCKKYVNIPVEIVQLFLSLCHVCSSQGSTVNGFQSNSQQVHDIWLDEDLSGSLIPAPSHLTEINDIPIIDISDDEERREILCQGRTNAFGDKNKIEETEEEILVLDEISKDSGGDFLNPVLPSELPNFSRVSENLSENSNEVPNVIRNERNQSELNDESSVPIDDAVDENDDIEIVEPTEVCLRWNLYDHNMKSILSNFFRNEEFVDVSLSCENKTIKCHKVILAASSPYFENVFKQNFHSHPVIVLEDLHFWQIQALIEFIYTGEIKIPRHKLESLLDAASSLKIKGLAEPVSEKTSMKNISPRKGIFKKKCNLKFKQEKKFVVKNISNLNKKVSPSKKLLTTSEIGIQTAPDINGGTSNSNLGLSSNSQISNPQMSNSIPNMYRVFTQTYIPVANTTGCQTFIPADHSVIPSNVASFSIPQITCPITGSVPSQQSIPIPYTTIPVTITPETTNLAPQVNFQKPSNRSFTVSCCSSTQTSPSRDNFSDHSDDHVIESPSISHKINVNNKNLDNEPTKKKKRGRLKNNDKSTSSKINSLISSDGDNMIFTRGKTADLQSVAKRTRKKRSENNKNKSKYADFFTE